MSASTELTANVAGLKVSVDAVSAYVSTLQGDDPAVVAANAELVSIKAQLDGLVPAAPAA